MRGVTTWWRPMVAIYRRVQLSADSEHESRRLVASRHPTRVRSTARARTSRLRRVAPVCEPTYCLGGLRAAIAGRLLARDNPTFTLIGGNTGSATPSSRHARDRVVGCGGEGATTFSQKHPREVSCRFWQPCADSFLGPDIGHDRARALRP